MKVRVSPKQFEIFYLHVVKDQSVAVVAKALEVSAMQVYLARHRVGRLLRSKLQRLRRTFG